MSTAPFEGKAIITCESCDWRYETSDVRLGLFGKPEAHAVPEHVCPNGGTVLWERIAHDATIVTTTPGYNFKLRLR